MSEKFEALSEDNKTEEEINLSEKLESINRALGDVEKDLKNADSEKAKENLTKEQEELEVSKKNLEKSLEILREDNSFESISNEEDFAREETKKIKELKEELSSKSFESLTEEELKGYINIIELYFSKVLLKKDLDKSLKDEIIRTRESISGYYKKMEDVLKKLGETAEEIEKKDEVKEQTNQEQIEADEMENDNIQTNKKDLEELQNEIRLSKKVNENIFTKDGLNIYALSGQIENLIENADVQEIDIEKDSAIGRALKIFEREKKVEKIKKEIGDHKANERKKITDQLGFNIIDEMSKEDSVRNIDWSSIFSDENNEIKQESSLFKSKEEALLIISEIEKLETTKKKMADKLIYLSEDSPEKNKIEISELDKKIKEYDVKISDLKNKVIGIFKSIESGEISKPETSVAVEVPIVTNAEAIERLERMDELIELAKDRLLNTENKLSEVEETDISTRIKKEAVRSLARTEVDSTKLSKLYLKDTENMTEDQLRELRLAKAEEATALKVNLENALHAISVDAQAKLAYAQAEKTSVETSISREKKEGFVMRVKNMFFGIGVAEATRESVVEIPANVVSSESGETTPDSGYLNGIENINDFERMVPEIKKQLERRAKNWFSWPKSKSELKTKSQEIIQAVELLPSVITLDNFDEIKNDLLNSIRDHRKELENSDIKKAKFVEYANSVLDVMEKLIEGSGRREVIEGVLDESAGEGKAIEQRKISGIFNDEEIIKIKNIKDRESLNNAIYPIIEQIEEHDNVYFNYYHLRLAQHMLYRNSDGEFESPEEYLSPKMEYLNENAEKYIKVVLDKIEELYKEKIKDKSPQGESPQKWRMFNEKIQIIEGESVVVGFTDPDDKYFSLEKNEELVHIKSKDDEDRETFIRKDGENILFETWKKNKENIIEMKSEIKKNEKESSEKIVDFFGDLKDDRMIDQVKTEKGSVYTYLEDGRTQRYKKATGETDEPQDAIVYIPDFEWIKKSASKEMLTEIGGNTEYGESEFEQNLLSYIHDKGKRVVIKGKDEKLLRNNKEISDYKDQIYLGFADNGKIKFHIPVSRKPRIGFNTFDTRTFKKDGVDWHEKHIGNKVIDIQTKEPDNETSENQSEGKEDFDLEGEIVKALDSRDRSDKDLVVKLINKNSEKISIFLETMESEIKNANRMEDLHRILVSGFDISQQVRSKNDSALVWEMLKGPLFSEIRKSFGEKLSEIRSPMSEKFIDSINLHFISEDEITRSKDDIVEILKRG